VLAQIETLRFLLLLYAQAQRYIEHFENHKRGDAGQDPGNQHGHELANEQPRLAVDQATFCPLLRLGSVT